jgi:hypothetical protein
MGMKPDLTTSLALAALLAGCGNSPPPVVVHTTPADQRASQTGSTIVLRGDYAPDEHGPLSLDGRYHASFTQRGAGVDFHSEVPFTAHLEQAAAREPARRIKLFQAAARAGHTTMSAHGRFRVLIDYGDSPYEIRLTKVRR